MPYQESIVTRSYARCLFYGICGLAVLLEACASKVAAPGVSGAASESCLAMVRASEYLQAAECYEELGIASLSWEQRLSYGVALLRSERVEQALSIMNDTYAQKPDDPSAVFYLAQALQETAKYEDAGRLYRQLLDLEVTSEVMKNEANTFLRNKDFLIRNSPSKGVQGVAAQLCGALNSDDPEYGPYLGIDANEIVFTRKIGGQEDLYYSYRDPSSQEWLAPTPLEGVNTEVNEGAACISADGRVLVFCRCGDRRYSGGSCDLYYAERQRDGWSAPRSLGNAVNTAYWESHPSLSPDGTYLFFSSDRPGGVGGRDIWIARRSSESGLWDQVINAGKAINTPLDEATPFLHPNGRTLYYASNGLPGFGGYDLFVSHRLAAREWSEPKNLGAWINNERDNMGIAILGQEGDVYYHEQYKDSAGVERSDLFSFSAPDSISIPAPPPYLRIYVVDARTLEPIGDVLVHIFSEAKGKIVSCELDSYGSMVWVFDDKRDSIVIQVESPGYGFYSHPRISAGDDNRALTIPLNQEWDTTQPTILHNLFFRKDSDELLSSSLPEIGVLAEYLSSYPTKGIEIAGHTDDSGSPEYNLDLSLRRAAAVKAALVREGVQEHRIMTKGYGESRPLATNETPEGRRQNRRTEFRLTNKQD